jgi:hypothetical protein
MAEFGRAVASSSLHVLSLNNNAVWADGLDVFLEGLAPSSIGLDEGAHEQRYVDVDHSSTDKRTSLSTQPSSSSKPGLEILNRPTRFTPPPSSNTSRRRTSHSLTDLHLSGCPLRLKGARVIARFLADPRRCGPLELLALNNCYLGSRGVMLISRAMEGWCFTLEGLQVSSNHLFPEESFADGGEDTLMPPHFEDIQLRGDEVQSMLSEALAEEQEIMRGEFRTLDGKKEMVSLGVGRRRRRLSWNDLDGPDPDIILYAGSPSPSPSTTPRSAPASPISVSSLPHHRLERLLEGLGATVIKTATGRCRRAINRNQGLKLSVVRNALALLPIARILLHARQWTDEECGRDVMKDLMGGEVRRSSTPSSSANPQMAAITSFPFMELPRDVVPLIIAHAQPEQDVLSDRQVKKLLSYAADRQTLAEEVAILADVRRDALNPSWAYRPPFRPGPGHYGRAEWQTLISGSGLIGSVAIPGSSSDDVAVLRSSFGNGRDMSGVILEQGCGSRMCEIQGWERERVDDILKRLGCDRWDPVI